MKKVKIILALMMALAGASAFAEQLSGCMVYNGKSLVPDPKCACVAKKECASFRKTGYNSEFFNARDQSDKPIFSEKIKGLYKQSYDLFNKVVEMKANGKGHSEEIKSYYQDLNYVNGEIRKELIRTQPAFMAKRKTQYEQTLKDRKIESAEIKKRLQTFASGKSSAGLKPSTSAKDVEKKVAKETKNISKESGKEAVKPIFAKSNSSQEKDEDDANKEHILNSLDKEHYNVNETDSLFDIITKTYKKRAYKDLLTP